MKSFNIISAALLVVLAGCGNKPQGPGTQIARQLMSGLVSRASGGQNAAALDPRQSLTREMIDAAGQPLLLVVLPSRNAAASLTVAGQNGNKTTWISAAGQSVTIRDGLVIATRALGGDLMSLDAQGGLTAIRAGGTTDRIYEFLNGEDQINTMQVTCITGPAVAESIVVYERSFATSKRVEICRFGEVSFENTYWFGADGALRKSIQWISFGIGAIEVTVL